jgi:hypothetical protein
MYIMKKKNPVWSDITIYRSCETVNWKLILKFKVSFELINFVEAIDQIKRIIKSI